MTDPFLPLVELRRRIKAGKTVATAEVLRLVDAMEAINSKAVRIEFESGVSHRTKDPFIHVRWGPMEGQLTPAQARQHAFDVLEAVEASYSDGFMVAWITEKIGGTEEQAVGLIQDFRGFRKAMAERGL